MELSARLTAVFSFATTLPLLANLRAFAHQRRACLLNYPEIKNLDRK